MSWMLGDDDPTQYAHVEDTTRRHAFTSTLWLLALLAVYGGLALMLPRALDAEHAADQRRLAPAIEAMRTCLGTSAPHLDLQAAMRRCAEQRAVLAAVGQ